MNQYNPHPLAGPWAGLFVFIAGLYGSITVGTGLAVIYLIGTVIAAYFITKKNRV